MIPKILAKATHLHVSDRYVFTSPIGSFSLSDYDTVNRILKCYRPQVVFDESFLLERARATLALADCQGLSADDWRRSSDENLLIFILTHDLEDLQQSMIEAVCAEEVACSC